MTEAALQLYLPLEFTLTFISVNFIENEELHVNKFNLKDKINQQLMSEYT